MTASITVANKVPCTLRSPDDGRKLLLILKDLSSYSPQRFDYHEPVKQHFDDTSEQQIIREWSGHLLWKRRKPKAEGSCHAMGGEIHASITMYVEAANPDEQELLFFNREVASHWASEYAFIHLLNKQEIPAGMKSGCVDLLGPRNQEYWLGCSTHTLRKYLPDLYWHNTFGRPYLELFGSDRLLSSPAHRVVQLENGCIQIQLTESVMDCRENFDKVQSAREEVKRHLGKKAFFDSQLGRDFPYDVPMFDFSHRGMFKSSRS